MNPMEQRAVLNDLSRSAVEEITDLWRDASPLPTDSFRSVIRQGVPDIVEPHIAVASDLSAVWYEEAAPDVPFRASPAVLPAREALEHSAQWSLYASGDAALARLAGATKRYVFGGARRTTIMNVGRERGVLWARTASATACEFCRMIVSRGAVYTSESAATQVGGNGEPVRGNQDMGASFHDHCRCMAVAIRGGDEYEPSSFEEEWRDEYSLARDATDGSTSEILAFMRSGVAA